MSKEQPVWYENLETVFSPKSVAVVGASRRPGSIGRTVLKNIVDGEFEGIVYPINPKADSVYAIKAYPDLSSVPGPIDLVLVVVPQKFVKSVIEEAIEVNAKGAVIISAGFREVNEEGAALEKEIAEMAKSANLRLVGPNCMGIIHSHSPRLNATFAPRPALQGSLGFISQSGALGIIVIDYATQLGLGFSKFISLGNKADINATNMIEMFGDDPETEVILAYLESFSDPWNFSEIATKTSYKKPIVMVKSGRTAAGARAASSHTGALATSETALEASLSKSGVIRVASVEELFDVGMAFSKLPLPKGNRIGVLTNAGGPGTLTTDDLIAKGLTLAQFSDETKDRFREFIAEEASIDNPIDLIASGGPEEYRKTLDVLIEDDSTDSIIVIHVPPIIQNLGKIADVIEAANRKSSKPIYAVLMGARDLISKYISNEQTEEYSNPIYQFPESAVNALRAMTNYATWKSRPEPEIVYPIPEDQSSKGQAVIEKAVENNQEILTQEQVEELFGAYGFTFPKSKITHSLDETIMATDYVGFPLVLKMASEAVFAHKTDEGGVFLDLRSNDDVIEAWKRIHKAYDRLNVPEDDRAILVQHFHKGGVEMALGISMDAQFGPMVMVGSGGVLVEILDDVQFSTIPLSRQEARKMIKKLNGYPLLLGYRGDNPVDIRMLEDSLLQLAQMGNENREISELDINPMLALEVGEKPVVLDARVKLKTID